MSNFSYLLRSPTFRGAVLLVLLTPYAPAQERNNGRPPGCERYDNIQVMAADLSGTSRGAFEIGAAASLNDNFVAALESFGRGQLPNFTSAEFGVADAKRNVVYGAIHSTKHDPNMAGTVTPEGSNARSARGFLTVKRGCCLEVVDIRVSRGAGCRAWLTGERIEVLQPTDAK